MSKNSVINGLLVTIIDDEGPNVLLNYSKLSANLSSKLAIIGMTMMMLGNSDPTFFSERYFKMIGPIPVPNDIDMKYNSKCKKNNNNFDTVAIIFHVKNDVPTKDNRILKTGRNVVVWLIFNSSNREKIFKSFKSIENLSQYYLKKIKFESQLNDKLIFKLLFLRLRVNILENNDIENLNSIGE